MRTQYIFRYSSIRASERMQIGLFISFWTISFLFFYHPLAAQNKGPVLQWQRAYGGSKLDRGMSICPTPDGGYIMTGYTESDDGDIKNSIGYGDFLLLKLDEKGKIQWQKCVGGSSREFPSCIQVTKEGGFIVAGYSYSNDKDVSGNHGGSDCWIAKLDETGNIQWQRSYGGSYDDGIYSIIQSADGGFVAAGFTESRDGDVNGNYGKSDYWILKLNPQGDLQWQKRLGGTQDEVAQSVCETTDGGYIVSGQTTSQDIDVTGFKGGVDAWIIKLSGDGSVVSQQCFGGSGVEYAQSVLATKDGGYVITGMTTSHDGDVSAAYGSGDLWIVKLSKEGGMQWNRTYGGSSEERGSDIIQTADSGYVVAGFSYSTDGDLRGKSGSGTGWIIRVTSKGQLLWQKNLGNPGESMFYSLKATNDFEWIAAGFTSKSTGNSSGSDNNHDCYVVKLLSEEADKSVYIPNAFTPNGDGLNEVWNLSFLSEFPQCKVEIYNRWGQVIFSTKGYSKPWDGTQNGSKVAEGVYCYVIDRGPGLRKLSGWVTVIR